MANFLIGLAIGIAGTFLVMHYLSPEVIKDKITGEVAAIRHRGRTFVDAALKKL